MVIDDTVTDKYLKTIETPPPSWFFCRRSARKPGNLQKAKSKKETESIKETLSHFSTSSGFSSYPSLISPRLTTTRANPSITSTNELPFFLHRMSKRVRAVVNEQQPALQGDFCNEYLCLYLATQILWFWYNS